MLYRFNYDEAVVSYQVVEVHGVKCLFTEQRLNRSPIPGFIHLYDLRHGDNPSRPKTIENSVVVNFFGTILTDHVFNLDHDKNGVEDKYLPLNRNSFKFCYEDDVCGTDVLDWLKNNSSEKDYDE